jgi:hypothetical protein
VAVSDDHAGLRKAIAEILSEAAWQRCYVHFLRNALDYLPRRADDDCLQELRRRTRVVRIFPNAASCLWLTRALCVETHEGWLEDKRYLNMDVLWEARKEQLRKAASASERDHLFAQLDEHNRYYRGRPPRVAACGSKCKSSHPRNPVTRSYGQRASWGLTTTWLVERLTVSESNSRLLSGSGEAQPRRRASAIWQRR